MDKLTPRMPDAADGPTGGAGRGALAGWCWGGVLTVAAVILAVTGFTSRDPDSTLYATMSARLSAMPLASWIAPEWDGLWRKWGWFREHPIGIFVLPALVGRAGYPPEQAAFAVGALFSAMCLWLLKPVVTPLVRAHEADAVQWAALIFPVAFVYRVRANQEYPVLALMLAALYATERARYRPVWMVGTACAAAALVLVKGIFVVFLPAVCVLWLLLVPAPGDDNAGRLESPRPWKDGAAWLGVVLAAVAVLAVAWMYEWAYHRATGASFLSFYLQKRIAVNAAGLEAERSLSVVPRLYNVLWYTMRLVWFAVPGSLVVLLSAGRRRRAASTERRGVWFAVLVAAMYVAAMSVGTNKADRFIFPAYFVVGIAGAVVAMRRWHQVDALARRLASFPSYALPLAWLALVLVTLATNAASSSGL